MRKLHERPAPWPGARSQGPGCPLPQSPYHPALPETLMCWHTPINLLIISLFLMNLGRQRPRPIRVVEYLLPQVHMYILHSYATKSGLTISFMMARDTHATLYRLVFLRDRQARTGAELYVQFACKGPMARVGPREGWGPSLFRRRYSHKKKLPQDFQCQSY